MTVRKFFPGIKHYARGIGQTAGDDPKYAPHRHHRHQGFDGHNGHPSHQEINGNREDLESIDPENLEEDPKEGEAPDNAEEYPSPEIVQHDQGERRISSRNQHVYGTMIENMEKVLDAGVAEAVVKGGSGITEDEACPVHGTTNNLQGCAAENCQDDQNTQACQTQQQSNPGGHGICDVLAS
jgi:hypothetical protein